MRDIMTTAMLALLCGTALGCTSVKFVQKNPYTGEVWTVYSHVMGADTITYCPPQEGGACREAVMVDGPPPPAPQPVAQPVYPQPEAPAPAPQ
jgi:hypothetical protein